MAHDGCHLWHRQPAASWAALRGGGMTTSHLWISDRPPTRDDADKESRVELAKYRDGNSCVQVNWQQVGPGARWRPTKHWQDPLTARKSPALLSDPTCKTCRYWQKWAKPGGECKRNSPQAVLLHVDIDDTEHFAVWPGTDDADWCGEWEARQ